MTPEHVPAHDITLYPNGTRPPGTPIVDVDGWHRAIKLAEDRLQRVAADMAAARPRNPAEWHPRYIDEEHHLDHEQIRRVRPTRPDAFRREYLNEWTP